METIKVMAFWDELTKIGQQARSSDSPWSSHTVGAPRAKLPAAQADHAPTLPDNPSPKLVGPASQYGKRQNYSQPNVATPPLTNTTQGEDQRKIPTPGVVFGVR